MPDGRSKRDATRLTAAESGISRSERRQRHERDPVRVALLRGSRALSALLALVLLVGTGLTFGFYNRLTTQAGVAASPQEIEGNVAAEGFDGKDMDILMIGTDTRTGTDIPAEDGAGDSLHNTDTIMLIHVPADGSRASVVSFPRDTWVTLPTGGKAKINAAYAYGYASLPDDAPEQEKKDAGQQWLVQTVSAFSGVQIDHFVEVTLAGFHNLTTQVGGIDVNLCHATEDLEYSGANFPAGPQHLDADQALSFVRQRHGLLGGDLDRIKRQQYFMGSMLRKVLDRQLGDLFAPAQLASLIDALAGTISFDKDLDPLLLAEQMRNVAAGNVEFHTIPLAGDDKIDGQAVLVPVSNAKMLEFFQSLSAPSVPAVDPGAAAPPVDAGSASPASNAAPVQVQVQLGTDDPAGAAAADLQARGYAVESTAPATGAYAVTEIQHGADMAAQAAVLAAALPGSITREVSTTPAGKLLVVVGDNYPGLAASGAQSSDGTQPDFTAANEGCIN